MTYNRFIQGLKVAGVEVDRKILAELAVTDARRVRRARRGGHARTCPLPARAQDGDRRLSAPSSPPGPGTARHRAHPARGRSPQAAAPRGPRPGRAVPRRGRAGRPRGARRRDGARAVRHRRPPSGTPTWSRPRAPTAYRSSRSPTGPRRRSPTPSPRRGSSPSATSSTCRCGPRSPGRPRLVAVLRRRGATRATRAPSCASPTPPAPTPSCSRVTPSTRTTARRCGPPPAASSTCRWPATATRPPRSRPAAPPGSPSWPRTAAASWTCTTRRAAAVLAGPTAWVFGGEAHGLAPELAAAADHRVRVPIHGRAESLNLATAAAVCLYASAQASRTG